MGNVTRTLRRTPPRVASLALALGVLAPLASSGSPAFASSRGPTDAQRRHLASVLAHRLLSLATMPPGARAFAHWNPRDGVAPPAMGILSSDPDEVDLTRYYLVAHADASRQWIELRTPRGARPSGTGTASGPGQATVYAESFTFASTPVLENPQLGYSMVRTPSGELGVRVDAVVTWTPQKPQSAFIGARAARVEVVVDRGPNVTTKRVSRYEVTSAPLIGAIITRVNALPVASPGIHNCPVDLGATMTLSFFARGASRAFASVLADPGGCGAVTITQASSSTSRGGVAHEGGGPTLVAFVAHSLGVANATGFASGPR
jgi:hypothetical protein